MYQTLRDHWTPTDFPLVEVGEDDYRRALLSSRLSAVRFAYIGLFIAAFRHFATLGPDAPSKERERKRKQKGPAVVRWPATTAKVAFLRHAFKLGFRTDKIIKRIEDHGTSHCRHPRSFYGR